jgi:hypothetical protein
MLLAYFTRVNDYPSFDNRRIVRYSASVSGITEGAIV